MRLSFLSFCKISQRPNRSIEELNRFMTPVVSEFWTLARLFVCSISAFLRLRYLIEILFYVNGLSFYNFVMS